MMYILRAIDLPKGETRHIRVFPDNNLMEFCSKDKATRFNNIMGARAVSHEIYNKTEIVKVVK